jgi:hypothetical protein
MKRIAIGVALLAATAIGCGLTSGTSAEGPDAPVPEGAPEVAEQATLALFEDDFSDSSSGWDIVEGVTEYDEGAYRIFVAEPDYQRWANPGRHFVGDVRVDVDVTKAGGPDDNFIGVICRYNQDDGFDYYAFQISSDGFAVISRFDDGVEVGISSEEMQSTDAIRQGAATNHVRVYCTGDQLTLWVNGENVASATDATYTDGDVGLLAATPEDEVGVDVRFDNLTVFAE